MKRGRSALAWLALGAVVAGCGGQPTDWSPSVEAGEGRSDRPPPREPTTDPTTEPAPQPEPTRLIFADEFGGSTLDTDRWRPCYPWGTEVGCANATTGELNWYTAEQVSVDDGSLRLTADKTPTAGLDPDGNPAMFDFATGLVSSVEPFMYGRIQFRARLPVGQGFWPALWLLPADLSYPPEIDVMEAMGGRPGFVHSFMHEADGEGVPGVEIEGIEPGWHTFSVDWRPDSLIWSIDGSKTFAVTESIPAEPMHLIMNMAVGGWAGPPTRRTPFPTAFQIDWVRVWEAPQR